MRKFDKFAVILFCVFPLLFTSSRAQDLSETLKKLSNLAAQSYLKPVSSGFGANLNTSWSNRVPSSKLLGVDIQLGVVGMGTFISDDNQNFAVQGQYSFTYSQAAKIAAGVSNTSARNAIISQLQTDKYNVTFSGPTSTGKEYKAGDDKSEVLIDFSGKTFNVNGTNYTVSPYTVHTGIGGALKDMSMPSVSSTAS